MKEPAPSSPPPEPRPFDAFKALVGKVVRVPKAEVDAMEVIYKRQQAKKPKRGPKPK